MYQQCKLKKDGATRIAYIPRKYAVLGLRLKLKIDGEWEEDWFVTEKYRSLSPDPPNPRKAVKEHEKNTGDSLAK